MSARLLAALMALMMVLVSTAVASEEADLKSEIDRARQEREEAAAAKAAAAAKVDVLKAENAEVQEALDAAIASVEAQLARVEAAEVDLANAKRFVRRSKKAEEALQGEISEARLAAKQFAVDAYTGAAQSNDVWFESADLSQTVRKVSYIDVANQNRDDAFDDLRQLQADLADVTAEAAIARAEVKTITERRASELEVLAERQATQERLKADVQRRLDEWNQQFEHAIAEEDELKAIIRQKEAELDELLNPPSADGWTKPTAGRIGSPFGPRRHPILGYTRMHNGVDISGASGTTIVAAANGKVILAGWNGGCGNTVIISHGGGLTSVYCHQREGGIKTSVGASVNKGEKIGEIGSTGLSTGPHLHFEIRQNGTPVDPRQYIG